MILGTADVRFTDTKERIDEMRQVSLVTPLTSDAIPVSWDRAQPAEFDPATPLDRRSSARHFSRAAWRGEQGEELRRLVEELRRLALEQPDARHLQEPDPWPGLERRGERRRLPGPPAAGRARTARRRSRAAAPEIRAEGGAGLQERLRRAQQSVEKEQQQSSDRRPRPRFRLARPSSARIFGQENAQRIERRPRRPRRRAAWAASPVSRRTSHGRSRT